MKTVRSTGLFAERPYFTDDEIEQTAVRELLEMDLLPATPEPVRIERFVEKRFGIGAVTYDNLPDGVLGLTQFGETGVEAIIVSRALSEETSRVAERRINSTIAHEAGHGLLHAHLFLLDDFPRSLFEAEREVSPTKILCRDAPVVSRANHYDGRWWEYQANQMMSALLLPRALALQCLRGLTVQRGLPGRRVLRAASRRAAALRLAETFDVTPRLAELRLGKLYPA
jgi:hypothetical protein